MQYLSNFFMSATTKTLAAARETRGKTHSIAENEHLNLSEEKLPQSFGRHRTENGSNKTNQLTFQSCALAAARLIKIFPLAFVKLIFRWQQKNRRVTAESAFRSASSIFPSFFSLFFCLFYYIFFLRKFNARIKACAGG